MEGIFSSICSLVEHIFGEQYELGVDYLQLLYLCPIQNCLSYYWYLKNATQAKARS